MQNTYKYYLKKEPAYSNENSVNLFAAWSIQFQHQHQHQHHRGTCITLSGLYSFVSTSSSKLTCVDLDQTRLVNHKIYLVGRENEFTIFTKRGMVGEVKRKGFKRYVFLTGPRLRRAGKPVCTLEKELGKDSNLSWFDESCWRYTTMTN